MPDAAASKKYHSHGRPRFAYYNAGDVANVKQFTGPAALGCIPPNGAHVVLSSICLAADRGPPKKARQPKPPRPRAPPTFSDAAHALRPRPALRRRGLTRFPLRLGKARDALAFGSASSATTVPVSCAWHTGSWWQRCCWANDADAVETSNALVKVCVMIPPWLKAPKHLITST